MSEPTSDRLLKIATFFAILFAIIGGSFYFGAMRGGGGSSDASVQRDARAEPARVTTAVERGRTTAAPSASVAEPESVSESTSDAPMQPLRDPMSAALLSMATRPNVLPESQVGSVEEELKLALEDLERCWRGAVGDNATDAKVFVHFTVDENGEPADLTVRSKGIGVPSVTPCFVDAARKRVYGNTEPGTSVYWPIVLDPESGARLR